MRIPRSIALLLAPALLAAADVRAPGPATAGVEHVRARLVRVPIRMDEQRPGGCADLAAESIEVSEDGLAAPSVYLDPDPLEAVHAVLLDTGPEMLSNLDDARRAALAYIQALPSREPALLATFDHRLVLHVPWTTDRGRFARSLEWIEPGAASRLWDSVRALARYVRSQPSRKVLIVVTRGCDSQGAGDAPIRAAIAAAAAAEALSVFVIGVDMPLHCEGTGADPLPPLQALAERTGGDLQRAGPGVPLDRFFRTIRERLEREMFAAYAPAPFGEGPADRRGKATARWRTVRARVRGKVPCRLTVAGVPLRCESASGTGDCPAAGVPSVAAPLTGGSAADPLSFRLDDIVRDAGPVAPSLDVLVFPSRTAEEEGLATRKVRSVTVWAPPARDVLRPEAGPADAFTHALSRIGRFGDPPPAAVPSSYSSWTDAPFLINGEAFLSVREGLGQRLAAQVDYGRWAASRGREERIEGVERMLERARPGPERELLERAHEQIVAAGEERVPDPLQAERFLGAWLGDVPAARVYQWAETWLARQLLAAARQGGTERVSAAAAEVERLWGVLGVWLPPPGEVRSLGWLVPAYDRDTNAVGYYRVLLAQPYSVQIRDMFLDVSAEPGKSASAPGAAATGNLFEHLQSFNFSRDVPLGAHLLRWMMEQDGVREILSGYDVAGIHYENAGVRDLLPALQRAGLLRDTQPGTVLPGRRVALSLTSRATSAPPGSPGEPLTLAAYFGLRGQSREYATEPTCLVVSPEQVTSESQRTLLRALVEAQLRSPSPCVLH